MPPPFRCVFAAIFAAADICRHAALRRRQPLSPLFAASERRRFRCRRRLFFCDVPRLFALIAPCSFSFYQHFERFILADLSNSFDADSGILHYIDADSHRLRFRHYRLPADRYIAKADYDFH